MIVGTVTAAVAEALEVANEKWVSKDELCERIACFTPDWMKQHAQELPRTRAAYSNRWCYPLHKINRLLSEGKIKNMDIEPIVINN